MRTGPLPHDKSNKSLPPIRPRSTPYDAFSVQYHTLPPLQPHPAARGTPKKPGKPPPLLGTRAP